MCNRVRSVKDWSQIPRELSRDLVNLEYSPNVAPTETTPAFLTGLDKAVVTRLTRFGITMSSADGRKRAPLLNARLDSLRRGSFRSLVENQRCIIPVEGFYEWKEENGHKQPYFFYRNDGSPLLLAGIWDYSEVKGDQIASFAILTDEPNELIARFHDRMPIAVDDPMRWLQGSEKPLDNIRPLPLNLYAVRPVNPAVNKVSEKDLNKIEAPYSPPAQASLF